MLDTFRPVSSKEEREGPLHDSKAGEGREGRTSSIFNEIAWTSTTHSTILKKKGEKGGRTHYFRKLFSAKRGKEDLHPSY